VALPLTAQSSCTFCYVKLPVFFHVAGLQGHSAGDIRSRHIPLAVLTIEAMGREMLRGNGTSGVVQAVRGHPARPLSWFLPLTARCLFLLHLIFTLRDEATSRRNAIEFLRFARLIHAHVSGFRFQVSRRSVRYCFALCLDLPYKPPLCLFLRILSSVCPRFSL